MRAGPSGLKRALKRLLPAIVPALVRSLRDGDLPKVMSFFFRRGMRVSMGERCALLLKLYSVSGAVPCPHTQREILEIIERILAFPVERPGCIVEAGCYKGGSAAKLSLAAAAAGRRLIVFDSFEGLPEHGEPRQTNIFGEEVGFPPGEYRGTLEEVKANIARFGAVGACEFRPGWFEATMPSFGGPIALLFLDVDLAESTRTVLKHLYSRIVPGGVLFSHDAHLPSVISVFRDADFWERQVGCPRPEAVGLGWKKLVRIDKKT